MVVELELRRADIVEVMREQSSGDTGDRGACYQDTDLHGCRLAAVGLDRQFIVAHRAHEAPIGRSDQPPADDE